MKVKTPQQLAQMLIDSRMATPETIIGCSQHEIATIEAQFGISLPVSYKEFLRTMGKEMGDFANDVVMTYPGIVQFCRDRGERYANEIGFELSEKHFVFLIREDVFMFFDTLLADPPVYRIDTAVDNEPTVVGSSFLEYLTSYVTDEVTLAEQLERS